MQSKKFIAPAIISNDTLTEEEVKNPFKFVKQKKWKFTEL